MRTFTTTVPPQNPTTPSASPTGSAQASMVLGKRIVRQSNVAGLSCVVPSGARAKVEIDASWAAACATRSLRCSRSSRSRWQAPGRRMRTRRMTRRGEGNSVRRTRSLSYIRRTESFSTTAHRRGDRSGDQRDNVEWLALGANTRAFEHDLARQSGRADLAGNAESLQCGGAERSEHRACGVAGVRGPSFDSSAQAALGTEGSPYLER